MNKNYQTILDAGYELAYFVYECGFYRLPMLAIYPLHLSPFEPPQWIGLSEEDPYLRDCHYLRFSWNDTLKDKATRARLRSKLDLVMLDFVVSLPEFQAIKEANEIAAGLPPYHKNHKKLDQTSLIPSPLTTNQ